MHVLWFLVSFCARTFPFCASLVIFLFYLVCLMLKLFKLCVVFPSGLDVSSSLLTQLTQSFLLLASHRIVLALSACVCLPAFLGSSYFIPLLPFPASFSYCLCLLISYSLHCNSLKQANEANKTTLSVLPSQNWVAWALTSRCLDGFQAVSMTCSLFCLPKSCTALNWRSL